MTLAEAVVVANVAVTDLLADRMDFSNAVELYFAILLFAILLSTRERQGQSCCAGID